MNLIGSLGCSQCEETGFTGVFVLIRQDGRLPGVINKYFNKDLKMSVEKCIKWTYLSGDLFVQMNKDFFLSRLRKKHCDKCSGTGAEIRVYAGRPCQINHHVKALTLYQGNKDI